MENTKATPKRTYRIEVLRPSPSMNTDAHMVEVSTYQEAVEECRNLWRAVRRSCTLYAGNDTYYYHRIDSNGREIDRNFNSGVPAAAVVA